MTIDEAINVFEKIGSYDGLVDYLKDYSVSVQDACFMAIKALKQYGALQEIRQEIEGAQRKAKINGVLWSSMSTALNIVDKHIKEIEE